MLSILLSSLLLSPMAVAAPSALETEAMVITIEPTTVGDDRVAKGLEAAFHQFDDELLACRNQRMTGPEDPTFRYLQFKGKVKPNGQISKIKLSSSTQNDEVDACVLSVASKVIADPRPVYPDPFEFNVTWKAPRPEEK